MKWKKLGLVFAPSGKAEWARSYAHLPTPVLLDDAHVRVFFASLDDSRRGSIGYVDLDAANLSNILRSSPGPVLSPGQLGSFDEDGVNPSSIVRCREGWQLYYIGWQRNVRGVPYALFAGRAESATGSDFVRQSIEPILAPTDSEPYVRSAPFVLHESGTWRCWYVCANRWIEVQGRAYPSYHIRLAESPNGVHWTTLPQVCIELVDDEFGLGRPWVIRDPDRYRMWYSIRSRSRPYRIGYAESMDGLTWTRLDSRAGIQTSPAGWDSAMICYAAVIDVQHQRYMFYNGNQHGESGFGLAILEQD